MEEKKMVSLRELTELDYEGSDMSLGVSVVTYGMVWKETEDGWVILYGIGVNGERDYTDFRKIVLPKDFKPEIWDDMPEDVLEFVCKTKKELEELPLPYALYLLSSYYGPEKLFPDIEDSEIIVIDYEGEDLEKI